MTDIERILNEFVLKNARKHIEKMQQKNEIIAFVKNDILGILDKMLVFHIKINVRKNIEVIQYMMKMQMHVDVNLDMNGVQIEQVV